MSPFLLCVWASFWSALGWGGGTERCFGLAHPFFICARHRAALDMPADCRLSEMIARSVCRGGGFDSGGVFGEAHGAELRNGSGFVRLLISERLLGSWPDQPRQLNGVARPYCAKGCEASGAQR